MSYPYDGLRSVVTSSRQRWLCYGGIDTRSAPRALPGEVRTACPVPPVSSCETPADPPVPPVSGPYPSAEPSRIVSGRRFFTVSSPPQHSFAQMVVERREPVDAEPEGLPFCRAPSASPAVGVLVVAEVQVRDVLPVPFPV